MTCTEAAVSRCSYFGTRFVSLCFAYMLGFSAVQCLGGIFFPSLGGSVVVDPPSPALPRLA